ncbi:MAG: hypothetical protein JSR79_05990, partial [Proteobacteria bacterium]|nr:hypothetical protein [Pseudomonadota bacterium]
MRTLRLAMTAIACLTAAAALAAARDLDFTATYPPQARAIPALKVWLERDSAKVRTELADEAVTDRRSAVKD